MAALKNIVDLFIFGRSLLVDTSTKHPIFHRNTRLRMTAFWRRTCFLSSLSSN